MKLPTVKDISSIRGKRVFLRVDFNVPIKDGKILDDFRIKKAYPTIDYLCNAGAKVILASHAESSDGTHPSLLPASNILRERFGEVTFVEKFWEDGATDTLGFLKEGGLALLDNLRIDEREKANDDAFAKELSAFADIYVDDAFAALHREHASIVGIPQYLPSYAGLLVADEILHLSKALNPERPFLFVLGGAKFSTKIPLVKKFIHIADEIYLCGALANNVYRERGYEVGKSVIDEDALGIIEKFGDNIRVPEEVVVESGGKKVAKHPSEVEPEETISDAGPSSVKEIASVAHNAKFVLWNGPLGFYENGFKEGTLELARAVGASGAESVIGGGDTLAAIEELDNMDDFTFVSTGGGAMLEYLANETLPGIEAIKGK